MKDIVQKMKAHIEGLWSLLDEADNQASSAQEVASVYKLHARLFYLNTEFLTLETLVEKQ